MEQVSYCDGCGEYLIEIPVAVTLEKSDFFYCYDCYVGRDDHTVDWDRKRDLMKLPGEEVNDWG